MATYTFYVSTNYVGSKREGSVEIPDNELEGMTESEKDTYIYDNYFLEWLNDNTDYGWIEED